MAGEFWLSEGQGRSHWAAVAQEPARGARRTSAVVHVSEDRLSAAGLPGHLWAFDDALQSLSPLDDARDLASVV
jgi:hypothetical protein